MPRRFLRPLTVLVCVAGAAFALAQGRFLAPSAPTGAGAAASIAPGDAYQGELVFVATCAGCHGEGGVGGGVGPPLAGAGLSGALIQARIEGGAGAMPAGLVDGTSEADVLAYVMGITAEK
jgi:mono/diheme cytochrome c family protein